MVDAQITDLPSASQMYRHANCPGNRILIRSLRDRGLLKDESPSLEASVGTRIHAALAEQQEDLKLSEDAVMQSCNWASAACAQTVFGPGPEPEIINEKRLYYKLENSSVATFTGKPDRVYRRGGDYLDVNFKTGRKEAPGSHLNLQLRTEVVLIHHNFKPERVFAAIVEPLVSSKPEIVCYEKSDLVTAEAEILKIVDRTNYETTRKAGPWCIHCPARAYCPESHALAIREPLYVFTPSLPVGEDAGRLLDQVDAAESILKAIKKHYTGLVRENFNAVPGWHISAPRNVRSIDAGAALLIMGKMGVSGKELIEQNLPVGKLEEFMSKYWQESGVKFDKRFAKVFKDAIKVHETKGHLKKIPKRLLK